MTMIQKTTDAYIRTYSDNGQTKAYVEWVDTRGKPGRTEGHETNSHMRALMDRFERENIGKSVRRETW
jgi:hypothetical protein